MNPAGGYELFRVIREIFGWTGVGWVLIISAGTALFFHLLKPPSDKRPAGVPRGFKIAGYSLILAIGIAIIAWPMPWRLGKDQRFENELHSYLALIPVSPREGVSPSLQAQSKGITGKVNGKMVIVNWNERRIDDLDFALPSDLSASTPEEVATVVLLTWEKRKT
jgi:hypothetical protein